MISSKSILSSIEGLPTLPVSLARISALVNDERSSMRDIEQAFKPDPALTANILRLANSAFFGCPREVTSMHQAVMLLGTKRVLEAAIGGAFSLLIPRVLPGYGIDAAAFWRHSVAVAVLSEQLSSTLDLGGAKSGGDGKAGDAEASFTAGLLHDIGKLVTSAYLAKEGPALLASIQLGQQPFVVAEREILGLDHAEVGAAMAEKWQLSDTLVSVVRWHHLPQQSESQLVDVVHIADGLAHAMGYGADVGELSRQIDSAAQRRIGATVQKLEQVASEAVDAIASMAALYADTVGGA